MWPLFPGLDAFPVKAPQRSQDTADLSPLFITDYLLFESQFDPFSPKSTKILTLSYCVCSNFGLLSGNFPIPCRLLVCTMCEGWQCRSSGVRTWVPIASEI